MVKDGAGESEARDRHLLSSHNQPPKSSGIKASTPTDGPQLFASWFQGTGRFQQSSSRKIFSSGSGMAVMGMVGLDCGG